MIKTGLFFVRDIQLLVTDQQIICGKNCKKTAEKTLANGIAIFEQTCYGDHISKINSRSF